MGKLTSILVLGAALGVVAPVGVVHAQDRAPPPFPFPFPLPIPDGGVPFIPVGPQPEAVPVNSEGWQRVVREYGPAMAVAQTKIVEDAVAELSRGAGNVAPRGGYRGTLLDSSDLNAFAISDGNVFVTRQLLAHMNDEDELIAVMGHEVGHVIGGHSRFDARANAAQRDGDRLLGVFLPGLAQGAQVAGTLIRRGFDRAQEHSADVAGVKFLADLGRDPLAMGRVLTVLEAGATFQGTLFGSSPPAAADYWLRTHPVHAERLGVVNLTASMAPRARPGARRSRTTFIRELDGMLFDDGPQQGIIDAGQFRHPGLKVALDAPPSFRLLNTTKALLIRAADGSSATLRMLDGSGAPAQRFAAAWSRSFPSEIPAPTPVSGQIGGMSSASGHAEVPVEGGTIRLSMWLYAWSDSQSFIYVTHERGGQASRHTAIAESFRRMSDAEAAALKVRRLSVVDIAPGDTIASLSARMAYNDLKEERFRLINGLFDGAPLPKSGPIKLVVWADR